MWVMRRSCARLPISPAGFLCYLGLPGNCGRGRSSAARAAELAPGHLALEYRAGVPGLPLRSAALALTGRWRVPSYLPSADIVDTLKSDLWRGPASRSSPGRPDVTICQVPHLHHPPESGYRVPTAICLADEPQNGSCAGQG